MSQSSDFRSDTVTLPTLEMMQAILHARLGDAARGDDPTVNELEALCCELLGMEDALFLPSASMANLTAVISHDSRGGEVIVEESAHIYNSEGGALSVVAGAVARPVAGEGGMLSPKVVSQRIRGTGGLGAAPTRLLCLENSHNAAGGLVMPLAQMEALHQLAKSSGIPLHLDGARLFNAAAYLGVTVRQACQHCDSVTIALSKGLGAPVGAVLAGSGAFMAKARRAARMLGGGMRQAGVIAAPAIVALEQDPYGVVARDHVRARRLAEGLATMDPRLVDLSKVQTNIVNVRTTHLFADAQELAHELKCRDVHALRRNADVVRFVTHSGIHDDDVAAALAAMRGIVQSLESPRRS
jgi:threonine aldolase